MEGNLVLLGRQLIKLSLSLGTLLVLVLLLKVLEGEKRITDVMSWLHGVDAEKQE